MTQFSGAYDNQNFDPPAPVWALSNSQALRPLLPRKTVKLSLAEIS